MDMSRYCVWPRSYYEDEGSGDRLYEKWQALRASDTEDILQGEDAKFDQKDAPFKSRSAPFSHQPQPQPQRRSTSASSDIDHTEKLNSNSNSNLRDDNPTPLRQTVNEQWEKDREFFRDDSDSPERIEEDLARENYDPPLDCMDQEIFVGDFLQLVQPLDPFSAPKTSSIYRVEELYLVRQNKNIPSSWMARVHLGRIRLRETLKVDPSNYGHAKEEYEKILPESNSDSGDEEPCVLGSSDKSKLGRKLSWMFGEDDPPQEPITKKQLREAIDTELKARFGNDPNQGREVRYIDCDVNKPR
ncbi:hypothetical protein AAMO2058_000069800 [Amorphochlora amoebiformis]